jgi:hypothetical protein
MGKTEKTLKFYIQNRTAIIRTLVIWLNFALLFPLVWHMAWWFGEYQAPHHQWLRFIIAIVFEFSVLALTILSGDHLSRTRGQSWKIRYISWPIIGLFFITMPTSLFANLSYSIKFGWQSEVFDFWLWGYTSLVLSSLTLPSLNLIFAGILGEIGGYNVPANNNVRVEDIEQLERKVKALSQKVEELGKNTQEIIITCEYCNNFKGTKEQVRGHKGACKKRMITKKSEANNSVNGNGKNEK